MTDDEPISAEEAMQLAFERDSPFPRDDAPEPPDHLDLAAMDASEEEPAEDVSKSGGLNTNTGESGGFLQSAGRPKVEAEEDEPNHNDEGWFERTMALADAFDQIYGANY